MINGSENRPIIPSGTIERVLKDATPRTPMSSLSIDSETRLPAKFHPESGETDIAYVDRVRGRMVKLTPGADPTYETLR